MSGETGLTLRRTLGRQCLPRRLRLRKRSEYLSIQARCRKFAGRHFTILAAQTATPEHPGWRLGVTVSRKVGNAVVRNRVKRWVRESFRRHIDRSAAGHALVIIARPSAAGSSFVETSRELSWLLGRLAATPGGRDGR